MIFFKVPTERSAVWMTPLETRGRNSSRSPRSPGSSPWAGGMKTASARLAPPIQFLEGGVHRRDVIVDFLPVVAPLRIDVALADEGFLDVRARALDPARDHRCLQSKTNALLFYFTREYYNMTILDVGIECKAPPSPRRPATTGFSRASGSWTGSS
jgi:hypothetical protein